MSAYVDSSVVLRSILGEPGAIENWSQWDLIIASELMRVEAFRAMDRLRVLGELGEPQLADVIDSLVVLIGRIHEVAVQPAVLKRAAAPFPSVVSALDAIHVATALLWAEEHPEPLVFVTHDRQQSLAARLAGLDVQTAP